MAEGNGTVQKRIRWWPVAPATAAALSVVVTAAAPAANGPKEGLRAFKPVADTYVTASRPRANFGRASSLHVDGSPETTAYLRFDLKRLKRSVSSVTLLLRPTSSARGSYAVRRVTEDEWRERRLTYANAPWTSARYAASKPVRRGAWSAVDVTPFLESGGGELSLAITTRGAQRLSFGSRESTSGPRLVVRFEDDLEGVVLERLRRK